MTDKELDKQLDDSKRIAKALKVTLARDVREGKGKAAELDKLLKVEGRIETLEQFRRLRELTREPQPKPRRARARKAA